MQLSHEPHSLARAAPTKKGLPMSPFSLSDSELDELTSLAAAIPIEHRDGFLHAVADVIAQYPENARGPGLMHREAAKLQPYFLNPPSLGAAPRSRAW